MSNETSDSLEYTVDNELPLLFIDSVAASVRVDGLYLLRLGASLPEGMQEQARLMMPTECVKNMLDILCEQSEYYPTRPAIKKQLTKKKSKKVNTK